MTVAALLRVETRFEAPLLRVRDLSVEFATPHGIVNAVTDVSFDLGYGERLAIVGESGSGKSVMASSLLAIVPYPGRVVSGAVELQGRDILGMEGGQLRRMRGSEVTMVFQDPMTALNPVLRIGDQIIPPIRRHLGLGAAAARELALRMLQRTGVPDAERNLRAFPHELSGGMRQRVLIAMAAVCRPKVLIADEPTTALDVTIQAQIVSLLKEIAEEENSSVIFVTHDLGLVARFAHRVGVMYAGRIVEMGPVEDIFSQPEHPYTQALLASLPGRSGEDVARLRQIEGSPPNLAQLPEGCAFNPRCAAANSLCRALRPHIEPRGDDHLAACWVSPLSQRIQQQEDWLGV